MWQATLKFAFVPQSSAVVSFRVPQHRGVKSQEDSYKESQQSSGAEGFEVNVILVSGGQSPQTACIVNTVLHCSPQTQTNRKSRSN